MRCAVDRGRLSALEMSANEIPCAFAFVNRQYLPVDPAGSRGSEKEDRLGHVISRSVALRGRHVVIHPLKALVVEALDRHIRWNNAGRHGIAAYAGASVLAGHVGSQAEQTRLCR